MTQIWNLSKIEIMVTHCEDIASLHYKFCKSQSHTTQPISIQGKLVLEMESRILFTE